MAVFYCILIKSCPIKKWGPIPSLIHPSWKTAWNGVNKEIQC